MNRSGPKFEAHPFDFQKRHKISGIVTTSDLSLEFQQLTEPFLLLSEIENHIRGMIHNAGFTVEELRECRDSAEETREIEGVFDLTFGEYIKLLENKDSWGKLKLKIDQKIFFQDLDRIRKIRNDVMHFDPGFVGFLQKLQPILEKLQGRSNE
jgi:hypothetical protein